MRVGDLKKVLYKYSDNDFVMFSHYGTHFQGILNISKKKCTLEEIQVTSGHPSTWFRYFKSVFKDDLGVKKPGRKVDVIRIDIMKALRVEDIGHTRKTPKLKYYKKNFNLKQELT